MKPNIIFLDYLHDILDTIERVTQFIQAMIFEDFAKDYRTNFAVVRGLEIIGEATKKVPQSIRDQYPDLPWREMAGMRDKLIHDYAGVNLLVVWKAATEDLPKLEPLIRRILEEAEL